MTRRQLFKIALWSAPPLVLIVFAPFWFGLVLHAKFNPAPLANDFAEPADALEAQRQDIAQFSRLIALDRSFSDESRAAASARIAELTALKAPLDHGHLRIAFMKIAALADNGHTAVRPDFAAGGGSPGLPLRLSLFSNGLYVTRAKGPAADLLGARLEAVGGHPIADVLTALDELRGGTEGYRRFFAPGYVLVPEILFGMGLIESPDRIEGTFRLMNGVSIERTIDALPADAGDPDVGTRPLSPEPQPNESPDWHALAPNDASLPMALRDFNHYFRRFRLDQSCTMVVQLKAILDIGAEHIGEFLDATEAEMRARPPCALIFDLRFSAGGNYMNTYGFAKRLPGLLTPGAPVFVLTSGQTFSAAITTVAFIKQAFGARAKILGEPVGDRMPFWAEGGTGCLPHAKLCFSYATGMHDYVHPCSDWNKCFWLNWFYPVRVESLDPDESITMSFADYMAHKDPVFDRAAALAAARRTP